MKTYVVNTREIEAPFHIRASTWEAHDGLLIFRDSQGTAVYIFGVAQLISVKAGQ